MERIYNVSSVVDILDMILNTNNKVIIILLSQAKNRNNYLT